MKCEKKASENCETVLSVRRAVLRGIFQSSSQKATTKSYFLYTIFLISSTFALIRSSRAMSPATLFLECITVV